MSGQEHSFCVQPSLPENPNPAEIPIQTTGCHVHELGVGWRLPWPGTWFLSLLRLFNPELEVCVSMFPVEGSGTDLLQHLERKCHQEWGWFHHPNPAALQELVCAQNFLHGVRSASGASGEDQGTSGLLVWGFLRHTDLDQWTGEAGLEECDSSWRVWGSEHLEGDVREAPARQ